MEQLCPQDRAILNSLFNPLLPIGEGVFEESEPVLESEPHEDCSPAGQQLNKEGVEATERGHHEEALLKFAGAIAECPEWAAPFNNRAQLYRLMRKEEEAVADLESAISLSGGRGKVACQALLQRGLLHQLKGEDDKARTDFQTAADMGSNFAKKQLVALNPMAALCNKMLVRMMADAQTGVETDTAAQNGVNNGH